MMAEETLITSDYDLPQEPPLKSPPRPLSPLNPPIRFTDQATSPISLSFIIGETRPKMKKPRTLYSTRQLEELERVFQYNNYPDREICSKIAANFGLTPQRIMVWFQNRRAKLKKYRKAASKKAGCSQPCVQTNRPPVFTASAVAAQNPKPGNTLSPFSSIQTSCTSPPGPPPICRASLPLLLADNPPAHTEHSSTDTTPLWLLSDTRCLMVQQPSSEMPQDSQLSHITLSPYISPQPTESSGGGTFLLLTPSRSSSSSGGHAYLQTQTTTPMRLQSDLCNMYGALDQYTQAMYTSPPSLPKTTLDPLLPNVQVESEDMSHSQPIRVCMSERPFYFDFSPHRF